ncbi:Globin domain containing protein, partial [Asbolus verrucosus]
MGIITSSLSYYMARDDDPDPVTGLTSRDRYQIQSSWVTVKKDLTGNGVALLLLFFKKFPEEQDHFPFKGVPIDQLKTSKKFHAHCSNVMYAFDALVDHINDSELLVNLLQKIGKSHKRHGIKPANFEHLKETLLELFGTFMSEATVKAWDKTLKVAFSVIGKEL